MGSLSVLGVDEPTHSRPVGWRRSAALVGNETPYISLTCEGWHTRTAQAQHEVQSGLLLNVVVGERAAILQLLARENEPLLVGRDPLLVLFFERPRTISSPPRREGSRAPPQHPSDVMVTARLALLSLLVRAADSRGVS
jgi:hypothetical protein